MNLSGKTVWAPQAWAVTEFATCTSAPPGRDELNPGLQPVKKIEPTFCGSSLTVIGGRRVFTPKQLDGYMFSHFSDMFQLKAIRRLQ